MTMSNEDKLRRADKALSQKADTGSDKQPWQEALSRYATAPLEKAAQAAAAIRGITGSWAAFYANEPGQRDDTTAEGAIPLQVKTLKLGQPGVPEVNFVPYSYPRVKTAGLLGHPISFSVVGPTLKSPALDTQWQFTNNSASPGVGDVLTLDGRSVLSPPGGPDVPPVETTIFGNYALSNLFQFEGGLYLVVSQTGSQGLLDDGSGGHDPGGVGDGYVYTDTGLASNPITPKNENSKFEIFRIVDIDNGLGTLTLDPNKRLATYFTMPLSGTPLLRAITLLEPYVSRMVAIPGSGGGPGQERVFSTISPTQTAVTDHWPPYGTLVVGPTTGTWRDGGYAEQDPYNQIDIITATAPGTGYQVGDLALVSFPEVMATEVMSIDTVADTPWGTLDGTYWVFYNTPTDAYYVWYTTGAPDPAPTPPDGVTYTGIQVILPGVNITAPAVADLTTSAINGASITGGNPYVGRSLQTKEITLFNAQTGAVPEVADGAVPTLFTIATDFHGVDGLHGTPALAEVATVDGGNGVLTVTIVDPGRGFSTTPTVSFPSPIGAGATATATVEPSGGVGTGAYASGSSLPIPIPIKYGKAQAIKTSGGPTIGPSIIGRFSIAVDPAYVSTSDGGKIIQITSIRKLGSSQLVETSNGRAKEEDFIGWFRVSGINVNGRYILERSPDPDPVTGRVTWGIETSYVLDNTANPTDKLELEFTLYDTVQDFHLAPSFDLDKVEAARLTNLIDPSWVKRSAKSVPRGNTAARADKAIFDTSSSGGGASGTNANPGSLLDLGFRMVLYPARAGSSSGLVEPDWDNPITSNEITLDPSINEAQSFEVDYASGLVMMSHTPVPGTGCDIAPTGIHGTGSGLPNNPRGEIVLYAACVPYSKIEGQAGSGTRIMGGNNDAFGERSQAPLSIRAKSAAQTFDSGINQELDLPYTEASALLPLTGFIELTRRGDGDDGAAIFTAPTGERASLYGYCSKTLVADPETGEARLRLRGVYGGEVAGAGPSTTDFGDISAGGTWAVLRRDVVTPNDLGGVAGAKYEFDTTAGFAKRSKSLRIAAGELIKEPDGTVSLGIPKLDDHESLFGELYDSWLLRGAYVTDTGAGREAKATEAVVLINGVRTVLPERVLSLPASATNYVYIDSSAPNRPNYKVTSSLPLPLTDDIIIALVNSPGASIISITDMRALFGASVASDGLEVLVGTPVGSSLTHFATLGEAITFVGDIMDPAVGPDGSYITIKIVGPTIESNTVPIVLPANGVRVIGQGVPKEQVPPGGAHGIGVRDMVPSTLTDAVVGVNGGNGYNPTDQVQVLGGTGTPATLTVLTTSAGPPGPIATVAVLAPGSYTVDPTAFGNAVTTLTGGGSLADLHLELVGPVQINLNGKSDWVWRDVYFRMIDTPVPLVGKPERRTLFTGSCTGFRFENVRLDGGDFEHGFAYSDTIMIDTVFRDCIATGVTDFGVYVADNSDVQDNLIDNCSFVQGGQIQVGYPKQTEFGGIRDQGGVRISADGTGISERNRIINNTITGAFRHGITTGKGDVIIRGNRISDCKNTGIHASGGASPLPDPIIEGNSLYNVATTPGDPDPQAGGPAWLPFRIGIDIGGGAVIGNTVSLGGPINPYEDQDIRCSNAGAVIANNICRTARIYLPASEIICTGNLVEASGITVEGFDCVVHDNVILGELELDVGGSGENTRHGIVNVVGSRNSFQNNRVDYGVWIYSGDNQTISNNTVGPGGGAYSGITAGLLTLVATPRGAASGGHLIHGNFVRGYIRCDDINGSVEVSNNRLIVPNTIIQGIVIDIGGSGSIISGNMLNRGLIGMSLAPLCVVNGNVISSSDSTSTRITGPGAGSSIVGNILDRGVIIVDGGAVMVSGNAVRDGGGFGEGIISSIGGAGNVYTGNFVGDGIEIDNADNVVITGNNVSNIRVGQSTPSNSITISGNKVTQILLDGSGYTIVGNHISGDIRLSSGSAGPDPDAANGIVVGNQVGTTIFGVAPAGTAKDNNK